MSERLQDYEHTQSPYLRPNQPWQCQGSPNCKRGPTSAGKCPFEEEPCRPTRSIRSTRRRIALWVFAAGVTALVLFLATKIAFNHFSPGPLSASHAEVAGCQDCHSAVNEPISKWWQSAFTLASHNDDQQCLECHQLGTQAFSPHSTSVGAQKLDPQLLLSRSSSVDFKLNYAGLLREWQSNESSDVSCAVCHREHQGSFEPTEGFNPEQCHTCHTVKFKSVEQDHPEYSQYPHVRSTRIQFNHGSHLEDYFLDDENYQTAPQGCKDCHNTDVSGEWVLSKPFEESCSSCHLGDILGENRASERGVAVLSIPELDTQTLLQANLPIGEWPQWADGKLVPIMRALMPPQLLEQSGLAKNEIALYDLSNATPEQLKAVYQLAWEIKSLFYDIQVGGSTMLTQRLEKSFSQELDKVTLNRLIASLPRDTLINNQREWLPNLIQEVSDYRQGVQPEKPKVAESADAVDRKISTSEDVNLDDDEISLDDDEISLDDDEISLDDDDISLDDDEISLDHNELESRNIKTIEADNESWAITGGWYRDGSNIRYRPKDHADQFFKTWLEVSAREGGVLGNDLFQSFSAEGAVGNCVKCHSTQASGTVDADKKQKMKQSIAWRSFQPSDVGVEFNRFSHVSHFSLMNDDGCVSCHTLELGTETSNSQPLGGQYSFTNMDKETCTQCHQQGRAPDNCLTCHRYHAEPQAGAIENISSRIRRSR